MRKIFNKFRMFKKSAATKFVTSKTKIPRALKRNHKIKTIRWESFCFKKVRKIKKIHKKI